MDKFEMFGNFTPGELQAAVKALSWAAQEQATTNILTKEQTEALKKLIDNIKELQQFFVTGEPGGFAAMRLPVLNNLKTEIISEIKQPIKEIVSEENRKSWTNISAIISGVVAIVSAIFWWIQHNAINDLINNLPK